MKHIDRIAQMTAELQKKNAAFKSLYYGASSWTDTLSYDGSGVVAFNGEYYQKVDDFHKSNFMVRQVIAGKTVELYVPLNRFPKRLLFILWLLGFRVRIKK